MPTDHPHQKTGPGRPPSTNPSVCMLNVRMPPSIYDAFYVLARQRRMSISQGVRKVLRDIIQGRTSF